MIKNLQDQTRTVCFIFNIFKKIHIYSQNNSINIDIPNVGVLKIKNGIGGVLFNEFLARDTKNIAKKTIKEKLSRGEMTLTRERLSLF